TGSPSAVTDFPTGTTVFDINFNTTDSSKIYLAAQNVDGVANTVGFVQAQFSGGTWTLGPDVSNSQLGNQGRGGTAGGNEEYYSSQDGIQHWDGSTLTQVTDGNTRMLELVGSVLYASTASTGTALPYSTGGGIYKFVNPNGVPTITHEITLVG